jgi:hypothetical protein
VIAANSPTDSANAVNAVSNLFLMTKSSSLLFPSLLKVDPSIKEEGWRILPNRAVFGNIFPP